MSSASQQSAASWHNQLAGWVHRRSTLWIFLSILAFGILVGHQTLGVIDRDEARFAQASKQMLESGDYITPRFMDELRAKIVGYITAPHQQLIKVLNAPATETAGVIENYSKK